MPPGGAKRSFGNKIKPFLALSKPNAFKKPAVCACLCSKSITVQKISCVKKKKDTDNLNIYLKTYEANETYEDNVKKIKADTYTGDSSKIRTFYDPDEKDLNGFLNIKPESLTGATSIYGLLKNSLQIAINLYGKKVI